MSKIIQIGIVGLGYWGPNLLRNFSGLDGCRVKYGCDLNQALCDQHAKIYPRTIFTTTYETLVTDSELDAIIIATPIITHYSLTKQALEAGKHVLIEKPMAASVAEAEELLHIAQEKRVICMIDHTFVYTGAVEKMKEYIDAKKIGTPYYFSSERISLGLIQQHHNVIWDLAPHDISILLYLFPNLTPISVSATGSRFVNEKVDEIAHIAIRFDSGFVGNITVSWLSPVKIRKIIIGGSNQMIVYDDVQPSEKIKIYDKGVTVNYSEVTPFKPLYRSGDVFIPKLDPAEALEKEAIHFLSCIRGESEPVASAHSGIAVLRILEACDTSMRERCEITLTQ